MEFLKKINNTVKACLLIALAFVILHPGRTIFAGEPAKEYVIRNVNFIGNIRIPERKIRELVSVQKGMKLTQQELDTRLEITKARMVATGLFMFVDILHEITENNEAEILISMGENVIFIDMAALEGGGFTRFSSLSPQAPDFGFMAGELGQALYFRFPYFLDTPLNLPLVVMHDAYEISFDPAHEYNYEAAGLKAALEMNILPDWKIKVPATFKYNIKGDAQSVHTFDVSTGIETLLDYSFFKEVFVAGFDLYGGIYQGLGDFSYTTAETGANIYIKPLEWNEVTLRGRYKTLLAGSLPDYLTPRIDNQYNVRGLITRQYYGPHSVVLNAENRIVNFITIPAAITNIYFSLIAFVDMGTAGETLQAPSPQSWNLSAGGALSVEFGAPLNIALQAGYGHEFWQNTGGEFYFRLGYEYRTGSFFE